MEKVIVVTWEWNEEGIVETSGYMVVSERTPLSIYGINDVVYKCFTFGNSLDFCFSYGIAKKAWELTGTLNLVCPQEWWNG